MRHSKLLWYVNVVSVASCHCTPPSSCSPHVSSFGSVPRTDRLLTMSAAAQRLASAQLRLTGSDRALKASYTPSPRSHRTPATPTPTATPNTTPGRPTPKRENVSLTDNLLQLPKRRRAEDFFWYFFWCFFWCFFCFFWCFFWYFFWSQLLLFFWCSYLLTSDVATYLLLM